VVRARDVEVLDVEARRVGKKDGDDFVGRLKGAEVLAIES
jgi:hypothetical protein